MVHTSCCYEKLHNKGERPSHEDLPITSWFRCPRCYVCCPSPCARPSEMPPERSLDRQNCGTHTPPKPTKVIFIEVGDKKIPLELTRNARITPIPTAHFDDVAEDTEDPASPQQETYASILRRQPIAQAPMSPQGPTNTASLPQAPQDLSIHLSPPSSHSFSEDLNHARSKERSIQDQTQSTQCPRTTAPFHTATRSGQSAPPSRTDVPAPSQDQLAQGLSSSPECQGPGPLPPTSSKPKSQDSVHRRPNPSQEDQRPGFISGVLQAHT